MRLPWVAIVLAACTAREDPPRTIADAPPEVEAPPDANPCGVREGMRGLTRRELTIDGLTRTYLVYLPPDRDPLTPLPLVLVFHGFTMSGQIMYDATEYAALADREGIAVAFPDGQGGAGSNAAPWNVGDDARALCPSYFGTPPVARGDDFAFVDAMKGDISTDQCIDRDHVFVTGFSMGGYFAHHAGCMRPDIRAIAPHSGGTHALDDCETARRPIIMFHGLSDPVIPAGCSDPSEPMADGHVAAATLWAQRNGCALSSRIEPVQGGRCYVYDDCPDDGQVTLCTFDRMSHCWAGGPQSAGIYACPGYASATTLEWEFWKTHAW